jgi:hypothetical protein
MDECELVDSSTTPCLTGNIWWQRFRPVHGSIDSQTKWSMKLGEFSIHSHIPSVILKRPQAQTELMDLIQVQGFQDTTHETIPTRYDVQ